MKDFTKKSLSLFAFLFAGGIVFSQTPFFSEDFDGALPSNWKAIKVAGNTAPSSNWVWTNSGPNGTFPIGPIESTTASNGWMLFDSDLNCSGNQNVWLVSPKLNLADKNQVILQFQTHYRRYNDKTWIEVSTDSVNWTPIEIFTGLTNNMFGDGKTDNPENPVKLTIDLTDKAANKPAFWFAFHFKADPSTVLAGTDVGCGYSWQIDDVELYNSDPTPAIDLKLGSVFYTPSSFAQPVSQVATDTFIFLADVSNVGTDLVTNIVFKATVLNEDEEILFVDSMKVTGGLASGVKDSTLAISNVWAPTVEVGAYQIRYDIYSIDNEDAFVGNNSKTVPWIVTDDIWSKENSPTLIAAPGGQNPQDWVVANVYTTSPNLVDEYEAIEAEFYTEVGDTEGNLAGKTMDIILLEVNDEVVGPGWQGFDTNLDYLSNPGLELRSINNHVFSIEETGGYDSTMLVDFLDDTPGVLLKPSTRYFLCASYSGDYKTMNHAFSTEIDYLRIFSTVIYVSGDQWYNVGFGSEYAATLRLRIQLANPLDAQDRTLPDNSLTFFPNPVSDKLNVQLSLDKPALANVTLADLNGRVILIDEIENAYQNKREYNVSNLPAGTYIVRVATKEGTKTKKFVVQR